MMQQIPFIDIFIDLFEYAVHVSGDKLAHPPEHFLTVYTAFGTMHRHWCRPVTLLFGEEFIITVERMAVHLSIWKQKGRCVDLLETSHSVVNVTTFMSAVKYMQCICRARVIVFNVPCVFPES